jgi:methyl-accepting chemotaxis protein
LDTEKAAVSMDMGTERVAKGMVAADRVNEAFSLIRNAMEKVLDKVKNVALEVEQMGKGSDEMVKEIELIKSIANDSTVNSQQSSAMCQEQLAATEEMSASSQSLSGLAEELNQIIAVFKL